MTRANHRIIEQRFNAFKLPLCLIPSCNSIARTFKNGRYRKYCKNHNSEDMLYLVRWDWLRAKIIKRDLYKCLKCGYSGENLEVDHINAIVNGGDMWDENNLMTLCNKCHKEKTKVDLLIKRTGRNKSINSY